MDDHSTRDEKRFGFRGTVAVASVVIGLAIVTFGLGSIKKPAANSTPAQIKPARVWNVALGNMVVVAHELGFTVKAPKNAAEVEPSRIGVVIEGQLQNLREIYRVESEKDPSLMGSMTLQFNIAPSGEVSQVKEFASHLADVEFKKTVLAEASKWSFQAIDSDNLIVNCPLLFVREGMDVTTVLQWEKSLGQLGEKDALATNASQSLQQSKTSETAKPAGSKSVAGGAKDPLSPGSAMKPAGSTYQIRYATSLRKEPNFSSTPVAKLVAGTRVTLLGSRGQWLEVRGDDRAPAGYVRKEFVAPMELAQKQLTRD